MKKKNLLILSASLLLALSGCGPDTGGSSSEVPASSSSQPVVVKSSSEEPKAKYTVTFDSNGGTAVEAQVVEEGAKATKPADPTKAETDDAIYAFAGWYLGDAKYDFSKPVTANITLVAHWETTNKYTVTFNSDGGSEVAMQRVVSGQKASKPADPAKAATAAESYVFLGWYYGDQVFDFDTPITENITLTAHWKAVAIHSEAHTATYMPFTLNGDGTAIKAYYRCNECYAGNNEENSYYSDAALKNKITSADVTKDLGITAGSVDDVPETDGIKDVVANKIKYADQCTTFGEEGGTPTYKKVGNDTAIMISRTGAHAPEAVQANFTELRFTAPAKIASYSFDYCYLDSSTTTYETGNETDGVSSEVKTHVQAQYKASSGYFGYAANLENDGAWHTFTLNQAKDGVSHVILKVYDFKGVLLVKHLQFTQYADITFSYSNADGNQTSTQKVNYGDAATAPEAVNYEKDGVSYTFSGWYDDPAAGNKVESFVAAGDKTYYAHYSASTIYEHIASIAPTATRPGVKESWVNLTNNEVSLVAPASEGNTIREKSLSDAELSALPSTNANYIAPGDIDSWLYQSDAFAMNLIGGGKVSDLKASATDKALSFHCGEGTNTKAYSAFTLENKLLKTASDLGYGYINFTVKANSVNSEWLADHYAMISLGNNVAANFWQTNYSESNIPLEKGVTFTLPLAAYKSFTGDDANDYVQFSIRHSTDAQIDSVESNVSVSDIRFLKDNYASFVQTQANLSAASYHVEDDGVVREATFYYNKYSDSFATTTGFSADYTAFLMKKGYLDATAAFTCTVDSGSDATRFLKTTATGDPSYSLPTETAYKMETGSLLYFGIPVSGGAGQQNGTIKIALTLRDYVSANLQVRRFLNKDGSEQTASSPYGIDAAAAATTTNGSFDQSTAGEGTGSIGAAMVMSEGAEILLLSDGTSTSKGGGFYGLHLNVLDYTSPKDGDIVVFKKGVYADGENQFKVARKLTLGSDLYYKYDSEKGCFLDATLAEAQAAGYTVA